MEHFFASGRAIDVVLAVLVAEAAWLALSRHRLLAIFAALMPAVLMMLALRAALTGMAWPWIAVPLAAAFPVHLLDLRLRQVSRP